MPTATPCAGGALALDGSYMLLLPEALVELLKSFPCWAVEELLNPEGETGSGVEAASADRVGCTVLTVDRVASTGGAPRSHALRFMAAAVARAIEEARMSVMLFVGNPDARRVGHPGDGCRAAN